MTTGGAVTHQWFSHAVLLSNVAEVSRAAGLKPDVVAEQGVVLQQTQSHTSNTAQGLILKYKMEILQT